MNLYYVRHGKTQGNFDKNYIGRTESPLTEDGIQSATMLGKQIKASGLNFDAIYTSSLRRQRHTAEFIAKDIGFPSGSIVINDLLLERAGGSYEGKPQSEFFARSEKEQIAAGAESFEDLAHRSLQIVKVAKQNHSEGNVLFVGSAAIVEMMRAMIKYSDPTKMFDDGPLPNAELIRFI